MWLCGVRFGEFVGMARKGTTLKTDFTGDDRQFQAVNRRVQKAGNDFGKAWEKGATRANRAMDGHLKQVQKLQKGYAKFTAKIAAALALINKFQAPRTAREQIDELLKFSEQAGIDFETFQRQANVFAKNNVSAQVYFQTLQNISRALGEAKDGTIEYQEAFAALNIRYEEFAKLDKAERIRHLAEGFAKAPDRDVANAALFLLSGRGGKMVTSTFAGGREGFIRAEREAKGIVTEAEGRRIAKMVDAQVDRDAQKRRREASGLFLSPIEREGRRIEHEYENFQQEQLERIRGAAKMADPGKIVESVFGAIPPAVEKAAERIGRIEPGGHGGGGLPDLPRSRTRELIRNLPALMASNVGVVGGRRPEVKEMQKLNKSQLRSVALQLQMTAELAGLHQTFQREL